MLRLGTLIKRENKNDVKVMVESFDTAKKRMENCDRGILWNRKYAEAAFRKAYMAKCTTYSFKNKQWVIKKLNQSTITDLNVFEESTESLTRKSVQMNTLAQYMTKSFQEAAEKASNFISLIQQRIWKNRFNWKCYNGKICSRKVRLVHQ